MSRIVIVILRFHDCHCGLVAGVFGYKSRGPGSVSGTTTQPGECN
jgi:hypothetical protein